MYWKYVCARKMNAHAFGIGRERKTGETLTHRDTQFRFLPCLSGNSPRNSDNLDQSVASTNPHLPGAQGKISRPSQVVRDWRHELTFSVFDSLLSQQTEHRSRRGARRRKKRSGVLLSALFPQHPFVAELRQQTLVMRSPPQSSAPGCETLTHSKRRANFMGHTC